MSSDHKELSVEEGMAFYGLSPKPEPDVAPKPASDADELRRLREKIAEVHAFMTASGIYGPRRHLERAAAMLKDVLDGKSGS